MDAVRRLAKTLAMGPESSGIVPVAMGLYYAVLATSIPAGETTTKLAESQLAQGLAWTRDQPWLDAFTRQLLGKAISLDLAR
jgi:hypothetical protein